MPHTRVMETSGRPGMLSQDRQPFCPVLVGRQHEFQTLLQLLDTAIEGRGEAVLLGGETGIGKSHLCRELANHSAARQIRVASGQCTQARSTIAYGPFIEALAPALTGFNTPTRPVAPISRPGITRTLQRLAHAGPVLLVLEDMHWADSFSLALLRDLSWFLRTQPVLLIATYRSDALHEHPLLRSLLAELAREHLTRELRLGPLAQADVAEMARTTLDMDTDTRGMDWGPLWERSQGNPFFVQELLRCPPGQLPPAIARIIRERVHRLGTAGAAVLAGAAVIGQRFSFELLQGVSGLAEEELLRLLEQGIDQQLILETRSSTGERYSFRYPLTREVLYGDLLAPRRRRWHASIAEALAQLPPGDPLSSPGDIAQHYYAAGDVVNAQRYELLAGDRAAHYRIWTLAQHHYTRVLTTRRDTPLDAVTEAEVRTKLADVLAWHNRPDQARRQAERAFALRHALPGRPETAALLRRLASFYGYHYGDEPRATACLQQALDLPANELDSLVAGQVANDRGRLLLGHGALAQAETSLNHGLALARGAGAQAEAGFALALLGQIAILRGRITQGIALLGTVQAAVDDTTALDRTMSVFETGARALVAAEEFVQAKSWLATACAYAQARGLAASTALCQSYLAGVNLELGGGREALETVQAAVHELRRAERPELREALVVLGDLYQRHGDLWAALSAYDEALVLGEARAAIGRAQTLATAGRANEGVTALERTLAAVDLEYHLFPMQALPVLIASYADHHRLDQARERFHQLEATAAHIDFPAATAMVLQTTGIVRAAEGDVGAAERAFDEAADAWDRLGRPLAAARVTVRRATLALEHGDVARGTALARTAFHAFEHLGAKADADRARAVLRRAGVRPPRRRRPTPATLRHGLTPRELEVLRQLARGGTNKAIAQALHIAEKTVSVHVGHILRKLRCATRTQAVSYAITHHLLD